MSRSACTWACLCETLRIGVGLRVQARRCDVTRTAARRTHAHGVCGVSRRVSGVRRVLEAHHQLRGAARPRSGAETALDSERVGSSGEGKRSGASPSESSEPSLTARLR
eukprot:6206771-Pleurochrysis_carterae.AAC.4